MVTVSMPPPVGSAVVFGSVVLPVSAVVSGSLVPPVVGSSGPVSLVSLVSLVSFVAVGLLGFVDRLGLLVRFGVSGAHAAQASAVRSRVALGSCMTASIRRRVC